MKGYQYEKVITIIGNKSDLQGQVLREQAEKIEQRANQLEMGYFETSINNNKKLKDIFDSIVEDSFE